MPERDKGAPGYVNPDAEATSEIEAGGGIAGRMSGGNQPFIVPSEEEVAASVKADEDAKAAAKEAKEAEEKEAAKAEKAAAKEAKKNE